MLFYMYAFTCVYILSDFRSGIMHYDHLHMYICIYFISSLLVVLIKIIIIIIIIIISLRGFKSANQLSYIHTCTGLLRLPNLKVSKIRVT